MLWIRVTGRGNNKFYALLSRSKPIFTILFCLFFISTIIGALLLPHNRTFASQALEAYNATVKILVENGYCGNEKVFVPHKGTPCGPKTQATVTAPTIAGGFEITVYGVIDPKILEQIRQVYLDIFFRNTEMKHLVINFNSNIDTVAQKKSENASIEMRRR